MVNSNKLSIADAVRLQRHKANPQKMVSEAKKLIEYHKKRMQAYSEGGKNSRRKRNKTKTLLEFLAKHERAKDYKQAIITLMWLKSDIDTETYFETLGIKDEAEDFSLVCP